MNENIYYWRLPLIIIVIIEGRIRVVFLKLLALGI
jgi:hypothetical protein